MLEVGMETGLNVPILTTELEKPTELNVPMLTMELETVMAEAKAIFYQKMSQMRTYHPCLSYFWFVD
jgi:hypothetical protein